jgi:hypothetical protein
LSWIPIAFSPVRQLLSVPEHEFTPTLEPAPVGGVVLGPPADA